MPRIYTTLFLVFETPDTINAVEKLRVGLKRLNQRLPYLKGRVFAADGGRAALRWSPTDLDVELQQMPPDGVVLLGLSFEKLKAERAPLHYFPPILSPLPRFANLNADSGAAVFAVNYGLLDGGIVLGLSVEHNVMDGTGVVEFIRFWAACTRSDTIDTATTSTPDPDEPLHRSRLLRLAVGHATQGKHQTTQQSFSDLLARHPEFRLPLNTDTTTTPATSQPTPFPSPPAGTSKIFTFSLAKLSATKTTLRPPTRPTLPTTTNSILCAILWSCITRVRIARRRRTAAAVTPPSPSPSPAAVIAPRSHLGFAINGRARLGLGSGVRAGAGVGAGASPALADPPQRPFLGNVNLYGRAGMGVDVLERATAATAATAAGVEGSGQEEALAGVVQAIGAAVGRVTPGFMGEVMELVERAPDGSGLVPGWDAFHGMDVTVTSWANMGVYEVDFGEGVGRPCFMRVPRAETDGFVIVLPRRRGGSVEEEIEVVVAMHPEDMAALEGDAVWRSYLV